MLTADVVDTRTTAYMSCFLLQMAATTLVYWGLNARATTSWFTAALGKVHVHWDDATANTWPATKGETPFGQMPYLKDEGHVYAQSMAIVRYLAKKGGIQGEDLHSFGVSEMVTEESVDIVGSMIAAKYNADPAAAYHTFFNTFLPTHYALLEKLLGTKHYFAGEKPLQGDAVLYGVLYLVERCNKGHAETALANHHHLQQWRHRFGEIPEIAAAKAKLDGYGAYFQFPEPAKE
jgi:glutathione S-transferase